VIPLHQEDDQSKLILHSANVTLNTDQQYRAFLAENGLQLAMQLPCSLDLISSHFSLFAHLNYSLHGNRFFSSYRELHAAIGKVMDQISIKTSSVLFKHQMERREQVSQNNNDEDQ
jgi:hypothetical protein